MRLSSAIILQIEQRKLLNYLLDLQHPDGKSKAEFFFENGITAENWETLEILLKHQARIEEIKKEEQTPFGKNTFLKV